MDAFFVSTSSFFLSVLFRSYDSIDLDRPSKNEFQA